MRVVSWNLARNTVGKNAAKHEGAWRYLEALDPDLALLQEVEPPGWASTRSDWTMVRGRFAQWGSVIVAKAPLRLTAYDGPLVGALDEWGYLATATLEVPGRMPLLVASVHTPAGKAKPPFLGSLDPMSIKKSCEKKADSNDVAFEIYRQRTRGHRFLISGDWNVARLWDYPCHRTCETEFFKRACAHGWVECYPKFHPEGEGRTWFGGPKPYQMDHAFCDRQTAEALLSCDIDAHPAETLGLSDHAPLLLEFKA